MIFVILQVNDLEKNVIFTTVITRKNVGDKIFIPITNLTSYSSMSFMFQRRHSYMFVLCHDNTLILYLF